MDKTKKPLKRDRVPRVDTMNILFANSCLPSAVKVYNLKFRVHIVPQVNFNFFHASFLKFLFHNFLYRSSKTKKTRKKKDNCGLWNINTRKMV